MALNVNDIDGEIYISITLCDDKKMQAMNKRHLDRDYPTDVLSFNIDQQTEDGYYLGDILVNKDQAARQAGEYENDLHHEIADLVEHGVLHLLGVHHEGDE